MSIIPFLIFAYIGYQVFISFTKAATKASREQKPRPKDLMRRLHEQNQAANSGRYKKSSPTQLGRERLARQGQNTPWGDSSAAAPTPATRTAPHYVQPKTQKSISIRPANLEAKKRARKASHKNPVQHGRRGKNMDQNRHRSDGWGERGDHGPLSGKNIVILLVVGGGVLYVLSHIPAL